MAIKIIIDNDNNSDYKKKYKSKYTKYKRGKYKKKEQKKKDVSMGMSKMVRLIRGE